MAGPGAPGEAPRPGPEGRVTVVVTTSPIPSHPSPVLLRALFASFREHLPGLAACPRVLVCDGYGREDGRPQLCPEAAYEGFLAAVEGMAEAGELGACRLLRLGACRGYGLALEAALAEVATEFVLVVQHDWLFVKEVDAAAVLAAMDCDEEVKYIGMQSLTTLEYARRMQLRYGLELPAPRTVAGLKLVPQLLWYDKPHFCRAAHYREVVLRDAPMGVCECPERRYGVELMWPRLRTAGDLAREHRQFGTFFLDVEAEVVYHLSGRKLRSEFSDAAECVEGPPLLAQLHGTARSTATFTAVAAERTAQAPGLAPPVAHMQSSRFKGRCFICGAKGHSKLFCPKRADGPLDLASEPPGVLAGC